MCKFCFYLDGGYTTLPCEQAKQVKTQFITKDHKLYSSKKFSNFFFFEIFFLFFFN
jgi:hypothetical protein